MKNAFEGSRYGSYRDGDRRRAEDILYGRAAPQPPKKKKKKKRSPFSILKLLFMTLLLLLLVGIGVVSAGVAWYIVKISSDLPSMAVS